MLVECVQPNADAGPMSWWSTLLKSLRSSSVGGPGDAVQAPHLPPWIEAPGSSEISESHEIREGAAGRCHSSRQVVDRRPQRTLASEVAKSFGAVDNNQGRLFICDLANDLLHYRPQSVFGTTLKQPPEFPDAIDLNKQALWLKVSMLPFARGNGRALRCEGRAYHLTATISPATGRTIPPPEMCCRCVPT